MNRTSKLLLLLALVLAVALAQAAADKESEAARRERQLKIPQILEALSLKTGSHVADIGAGDGNYESALARTVGPTGRVYAEDIDEKNAIKRLKERAEKEHLDNVEVILGTADDPNLPVEKLDGALMVIMYHEIEKPAAMLEHVRVALKPGGRLVIVEIPPRKTASRPRADQVKNHVISADIVAGEVVAAGFEVISRDDHFIDPPDEESTRWMIIFRKP